MLIEFLEELLENRKKYAGTIWGFIFGLILIKYGFTKMIIVLCVTIIGYFLGEISLLDKIRKIYKVLLERLKED